MKKLAVFPLCLGCILVAATSHAIDLKQSKITQVINDVQIISAADQKEKVATVNDIFAMPDILRTGAASRAELVAADETVTRVGANTIFSFDPENRSIDLKQGSLLFHSPHGKGGGTIHTGSATASVLGTTLIIVTTKNGGLKVIALEGEVEVKFLNGLKQKLDPGQMTFVLPGANQLAPVIIFRLDELTENSLLIKGFTQTLQSLPLIENQIKQQIKLIGSGKFSDTGLDVGDGANQDQVEVLDVNTIPHQNGQTQQSPPSGPPPPPPPPPSISAAEAADAYINFPSLSDPGVPTPPTHIFITAPFSLTGNSFFGGQNFFGFVANNIFVNTPNTAPLTVDLSLYGNLSGFDIVAENNFSIEGPVNFAGLPSSRDLTLIAGNQFIFTPGVSLTANVHDLLLSSPGSLTFDNFGLYNADKDINLNTSGDVSFTDGSVVNAAGRFIVNAGGSVSVTDSQLTGNSILFTPLSGSISLDDATLNAPSHIIFLAPGGISLNNSTINSDSVNLIGTASADVNLNNSTLNTGSGVTIFSSANLNVTGDTPDPGIKPNTPEPSGSALNADPASGSINLSASGSISITGTSISAHYLTLNSGDGILLDGAGHTITATGPGATAHFTAPNLVTINNVNFCPFATVNIAANTIVLAYDIFSTTKIYNFASQTGTVAINSANPGGLALYYCYLGTTPITSSSQVNITSGPGTTAGLFSFPK